MDKKIILLNDQPFSKVKQIKDFSERMWQKQAEVIADQDLYIEMDSDE